ncbi:hypothetical protein GCM10028796_08070 [Ramlibacter monticola]|uniref:DUF2059 domain-containing protein n=1 Tax=Ramlibacter monticola TaxID=1926872 RepID=A0A936YVE8_9BURK|nr:hypothetical protein [Ramlibacter monticola]MBL0389667.1 hypothetical protein [Ramlibacter monticola]
MRFPKTLLILAIAAACSVSAQAQSTPAKKELVARILKVQQPGMEAMARNLVEQPAMEMLERAGAALPQRVAADKREAVGKDIQNDVKKFVDDTVPIVRDRVVKIAPSSIGVILEEKFTEAELKEVAAMMESPTFAKFQAMGGELQRALVEKLVADTKPQVEPKLRGLEEGIAKRLGVNVEAQKGAAPAAAAPKAPAKK